MSGFSNTMKYLSPAYGLFKGMKDKDSSSPLPGGLFTGGASGMSGALTGPISGLLSKKKPKTPAPTIAGGY